MPFDSDTENLIQEYIASLSDMQKQTIEIGKEILGDSFEITKTINYQSWLKTREE
jgi:hypothetical protein